MLPSETPEAKSELNFDKPPTPSDKDQRSQGKGPSVQAEECFSQSDLCLTLFPPGSAASLHDPWERALSTGLIDWHPESSED